MSEENSNTENQNADDASNEDANNASTNDGDSGENSDGDKGAGEGKIYRPEGLPDHMLGKTDQETIDLVAKAYKGARDELAKGSDVPKTADDYVLEIPEDMKDKVIQPGEDGKDPFLEILKPLAHKHNIGQKAFQDFGIEFSKAVQEKLASVEQDEDALADFEYKEYGGMDKAKPVVDGVSVWAQGLKNQGKLNDADIKEINLMSTHSQGLKTLSKLREMTGEKPIPVNMDGKQSGKEITEDTLNSRVADPRYQAGNPKFDPAFHKETTQMFQEFYNQA